MRLTNAEETASALVLKAPPAPVRRRKLWEVDCAFHCPLIGTCLPIDVLRRFARRAGLAQAASGSDYELHHAAVHLAGARNELSRLVHKALDTRFAAAVIRFAAAGGDDALLALWRAALAGGEVAGALWALMTHPRASQAVLQRASQDVHMLSHQVGAASRADLRRLAQAEAENRSLRERLEEQQFSVAARLAAKEERIDRLERQLAGAAGTELRLQDAERELRSLRAKPIVGAPPDEALRGRLAEAEARCARLALQVGELSRERDAIEAALQAALPPSSRTGAQRRACELGGCRVLYVGGRAGLVEHYRLLVERHGGTLLHHDGGLEESLKRLQPLLASADMVVCAAGETSHAAYYIAKRFCKQAGKPCALLQRPSLASLLRALQAFTENGPPASPGDTLLMPAAQAR